MIQFHALGTTPPYTTALAWCNNNLARQMQQAEPHDADSTQQKLMVILASPTQQSQSRRVQPIVAKTPQSELLCQSKPLPIKV
jgi:hypothetical protein